MKFSQFTTIPSELKVQIIRKCNQVPYVRLRQTCRSVDDFCEKNRRRLGVYSRRKDPFLIFTKCLFRHPVSGSEPLRLAEYHLFVNYDVFDPEIKYMAEVSEEKALRIKKSLSGFAFTHIFIDFLSYSIEKLNKALPAFLGIVTEFKVKQLTLPDLPAECMAVLLNNWKIEHLQLQLFASPHINHYLNLDCVKRVSSISYCIRDWVRQLPVDIETVVDFARGKKTFKFVGNRYSLASIWDAINAIYGNWQKDFDTPDTMHFCSSYGTGYKDLDIIQEFCDRLPLDIVTSETIVVYKRKFMIYEGEELWREPTQVKHNLWIIKVNQNQWRILTVTRGKYNNGLKLRVQTARNQRQLLDTLIVFVGKLTTNPTDLSTIYKKLAQMKNPDELAKYFSRYEGHFQ